MKPDPDIVVVGAGPAGAFTSALLARLGMRVLIIERGSFPRHKVCGCCLAEPGARALEDAGLAAVLDRAGTIDRMRFATGGRSADVRLPAYRMLGRDTLDMALLDAARDAGCEVLFEETARVSASGAVSLGSGAALRPNAVVVADGLTGPALRDQPGFGWKIRQGAPIGLGLVGPRPDQHLPADRITMAVGASGYVGLAPIDDARWTIAAAVLSEAVRAHGPDGALRSIYEQATGRTLRLHDRPTGVGPLTRRRERVESQGRVFLVGDACGYAEPMTGQGMSWALSGAAALAPIVARAAAGEAVEGAWQRVVDRRFRRAHAACASLTRLVRWAPARRAAVVAAGAAPLFGRLAASTILAAGTPRIGAPA